MINKRKNTGDQQAGIITTEQTDTDRQMDKEVGTQQLLVVQFVSIQGTGSIQQSVEL